jgi:membrane fusion protein (multidrug efflux system)
MFARVDVTLPEIENVVVIPSTAVSYASYGNSVYVIEILEGPDGSEYLGARQQPVELGAKRGDMVSVVRGLAGDEEVATAGVFKLRNGLPVQVNNNVIPSESETPNPQNS